MESVETKVVKFVKSKKSCSIASIAKYLKKNEKSILPILHRLKKKGKINLIENKVELIKYPNTLRDVEEFLSDEVHDQAVDLLIGLLQVSNDTTPDFWQEVLVSFFECDIEESSILECCANAFMLGALFEKNKEELLKFHK